MPIKLTFSKEGKEAVDKARATHADMFEGLTPAAEDYNEALFRWAREHPEEVAPYRHAIGTDEKAFPLELLNHWAEIEYFSRDLIGETTEDVVEKWINISHPDKGGEKTKEGFGGKEVPGGARD